MTSREPKTNAEVIDDIRSDVVSRYLSARRHGLVNPKDFFLARAERQVESQRDRLVCADDFVSYYSALAVINAARGQFIKAEEIYLKAVNLKPSSHVLYQNHMNLLMRSGRFEEAKSSIEEYFENGGNDYSLLFTLHTCGIECLDFSMFKGLYNHIKHKDLLSEESKSELEKMYKFSEQLESLPKHLSSIDVKLEDFGRLFAILYSFHCRHLYDGFRFVFSIENNDDKYVEIEVFASLSLDESIEITNKFESILVDYAIDNNRDDILSKFLVYFKPLESEENADSAYLGITEGLVV